MAMADLRGAAMCRCDDVEGHAARLLAEYPGEIHTTAESAVTPMLRSAWEAGWTPLDVVELARRRLPPPAVEHLGREIVDESRRYAAAMVHPRWRAAVDTIAAAVPLRGAADLVTVLQTLRLLSTLPVLERLLPLPGECRHRVAAPVGEVDQKALGRVRALLAKAESTEFPEEAEALSAKAQELMSRYSLHQAVLDHDRGRAPAVSGRRLWRPLRRRQGPARPGGRHRQPGAHGVVGAPGVRHGRRRRHRSRRRRAAHHVTPRPGQPGDAGCGAAHDPGRHVAHEVVPSVVPDLLLHAGR